MLIERMNGMNIAEKFNEKKRMEKEREEVARQQKVNTLANRIMGEMSDATTVEHLENYLMENGAVAITDFGCLCQGGFCSWQKGLRDLLQPLIKEWDQKGVIVDLSMNLNFKVKSKNVSSYKQERTIEQLVNETKKR